MTRQLLTYERTQKEDEELTYFDKAVSVYWDCLIDKDSAEASRTSRCTRVAKWSNDYMEYLTTWSKQHPDGHEDEAYIEYLEHETKDPISVEVNGIKKFTGFQGAYKGHKAINIDELIYEPPVSDEMLV